MQTSEIINLAQSVVEWLVNKGAPPTLFIVALMLWAVNRTGSSHLLTSRLWHLVLGKRKTKSSSMREFFEQRDELMRLRMHTGLTQIGTHAQGERLLAWVKKHDVDIDLVRRCGGHFDLSKPGLRERLPGLWVRSATLIGATLFLYLATAQIAFMIATPPLAKVVKSARWYGITHNEAFHIEFNHRSARFGLEDCSDIAATAGSTGYPSDDVSALCELWKSGRAPEFLKRGERDQRIGLGLGSAMSLLWCVILLQGQRRGDNAAKLKKLLDDQSPDATATAELDAAKKETEVLKNVRQFKAEPHGATKSEAAVAE